MAKFDSRNSQREAKLSACLHHLHCVRLLQKAYYTTKDKTTLKRALLAEKVADEFIQDLYSHFSDYDKNFISNFTTFEDSDELAF